VKILGKVENLVCRILRSFSTGDKNGFDVHDKRGKYFYWEDVESFSDVLENVKVSLIDLKGGFR
jgi:hypothetical protein